jgi:hypothetical protein
MAEEEKFEMRAAAINKDAVLDDEDNLNVAFLQINLRTLQISFHWLPDFFAKPIPELIRKEIAKRLRIHADRLESGELGRNMQKYIHVNDPEKHD